jgi:hypothetical protein
MQPMTREYTENVTWFMQSYIPAWEQLWHRPSCYSHSKDKSTQDNSMPRYSVPLRTTLRACKELPGSRNRNATPNSAIHDPGPVPALFTASCQPFYLRLFLRGNLKKQISNETVNALVTTGVCIATGYGMDDRGVAVRVPVGSTIFYSPYRPDRLWGPSSFISNGNREFFPRG